MEFPQPVLEHISRYLTVQRETIAVAESVTSGFLQLAFSQMPGAEQFYNGGITAYSTDEKIKQLGIDQKIANSTVSKELTNAMALAVADRFGTDWGLAATGYASPSAESDGSVFSFYSIAYRGRVVLSDFIELHPLTKPLDAKNYFTECLLSCLRRELNEHILELTLEN